MDVIKAVGVVVLGVIALLAGLTFFGKLDGALAWLINGFVRVTDAIGHTVVRVVRVVLPTAGDVYDTSATPEEEDEPADGNDSDRELNPAARKPGLTREQRDLDLDGVVANARLAAALAALADDGTTLDDRLKALADQHWERYGGRYQLGRVLSDYAPYLAAIEQAETVVVAGEVVPNDERVDGVDEEDWPRAGTVLSPIPPFEIWDGDKEKAPALDYNALGGAPELENSGALRWPHGDITGAWSASGWAAINNQSEVSA